jgi:hypothetical protein
MAITVLMKEKYLRQAINMTRIAGIAIILFGLGLRLAGSADAKLAFITGAILVLFARVNQWWLTYSRKPVASGESAI